MKYKTSISCLIVGIMAFGFSGMATAKTNESKQGHTAVLPLVIQKQKQTINFGAAPNITAPGGTGNVTVAASSGLTVTLTSKTPKVCSVSGNSVSGLTAGVCVIAADQAGNTSYAAAVEVLQSFSVKPQVSSKGNGGEDGNGKGNGSGNGNNGNGNGNGNSGNGGGSKLAVTAPFDCKKLATSGNAIDDGRRAYIRLNCVSCHGQDGTGGMGPNIAGSGDDVAEAVNGEGAMPSYAGFLCPNDVVDLQAYLSSISKTAKYLDWDVQFEQIKDGAVAPKPTDIVVAP